MVPGAIHQFIAIHAHVEPELNDYFVRQLESTGLIESSEGRWQSSDRGRAWMAMLCETPLPVKKWTDPRLSIYETQESI